MTYGDLINQIRDLGFGDDTDIDDFEDQIPTKINLAIAEINQFIGSIVASVEIEVDELDSTNGIIVIDMEDVAEGFVELAELPIVCREEGKQVYKPFNDFDTREEERWLYINASGLKGTLKIYYKKEHTQFDSETDMDAIIELPKKVQLLIPFLASYYIWLEDDPTKAVYYYNRYESLIGQIKAKPSRMRIKAGGI